EATGPAPAHEVLTEADERTRRSAPPPHEVAAPTRPTRVTPPRPPFAVVIRRWGRLRRYALIFAFVRVAIQGGRLGSVLADARELREGLASRDAGDLETVWSDWESIESRSVLGMGPGTARGPLLEWLVAQAQPLLEDYRSE